MKVILRLFSLWLVFFSATGCNFRPNVEISGTAQIASGVVLLTDELGQTISSVRITNNQFTIKSPYLKKADIYTIVLAADKQIKREYPVYLETGQYVLKFKDKGKYPVVTSGSKTQKEISAYYAIRDSINKTRRQHVLNADKDVKNKFNTLNADELNQALNVLSQSKAKESSKDIDALDVFVTKHPENTIAAYIMKKMFYESDVKRYFEVYKKFNNNVKKTADGKEIGEKLELLVKLEPGMIAPEIEGLTPQGEKLDLKKLKAKLILIEFWKAASGESRRNHQEMMLNPFDTTGNTLKIVSINLETKRDWWLTSAEVDKINWMQVSDLKGNNSPNVKNWAVTTVPTYCLLNGNGRIIERDIDFRSIRSTIALYLSSHPN